MESCCHLLSLPWLIESALSFCFAYPPMVSSYLALLKAVYDYAATSEDELSIKEEGLYFLLDNSDPDWHKVRAKSDDDDEPVGLVPAAYLEEVEPISVAKSLYDYAATADGELTITEDEVLHVFEKDEDWWLVKGTANGGKVGLVPGNYVDEAVCALYS